MKMRTFITVMVVSVGMMLGQGRAETPAGGRTLEALSKASEALYQQVSQSIVRVKTDQIGIPRELQKEFEAFVKTEIGEGGGRPSRQALARRFMEQKNASDPNPRVKMRTQQTRELLGVVIDNDGHVLVAGSTREMPGGAGHVTMPDGSDAAAKYIGSHVSRGWMLLKLDSPNRPVPITLATGRPAAGALLMSVTPQGSLGYVVMGTKEEHGTMYLFNAHGELAAIGTDRQAMTIDSIKADLDWIIANRKDIQPRRMGVTYDPVTQKLRAETPGLGDRPAVVVKEVQPNSPAEKAGLKKNDIVVTIAGKPIWQMGSIQRDMSKKMTMEIFRDGKEMTVELQFGE
ncbi:MAG: PDZ domain-containing protein [Phycisphaerales bacterium]|nr:PDZ domain-containing protein [Phycisphaerales bacterium]